MSNEKNNLEVEEKINKFSEEINSLKKEIFEERIKRQANFKVFALVSAVLLAVLGYSNFLKIPAEVDHQLEVQGVETVRNRITELLDQVEEDSRKVRNNRDASFELVGLIETELDRYAETNSRLDEADQRIKNIGNKLSKLSFDKENNLILSKGLIIPYKSGISIQNVPSWQNGEFRIMTTGWENGKGDYLRFYVPGNDNKKGHIFAIYDTGRIEVNGSQVH